MNFKKSLAALAVAGVIATPAQADLYASARIGLVNRDTGGVSDMSIDSVASRMGVKSETDLGNGMTGFGKYEFSVNEAGGSGEDSTNTISTRHMIVGLKGDFGSVTMGQTYHTFYNHVVGPLDIPWIGSGFAMVSYTGRTNDGLTYAGSAGDISFGATAYLTREAEEDAPDGTEFGASFGIAGMTLGIAMQDSETQDDPTTGVTLHGIDLGGASLGFGYQVQDEDSSIVAHAGIGNLYVHLESLDIDGGNSPSLTTVGYNMPLGRKTLMYFEYVGYDADSANSDDDDTRLAAVLKYDIE